MRVALIAGGIAIALAWAWGTWHYLRAERAEHALLEYQAAAAAVITQRLEDNARIEAAAAARLTETNRDFETRLAATRARYQRLRPQSGTGGQPLPETPGPKPGGMDAAPGDPAGQLPRCVAADRRDQLERLLEAADTCALRLSACQRAVMQFGAPP